MCNVKYTTHFNFRAILACSMSAATWLWELLPTGWMFFHSANLRKTEGKLYLKHYDQMIKLINTRNKICVSYYWHERDITAGTKINYIYILAGRRLPTALSLSGFRPATQHKPE